jgi:hypothetical protein
VVSLTVKLPGQKLIVVAVVAPDATWTCPLAVAYPGAEADIVADPTLVPLTIVTTRGAVVVPSDTKMVAGDTVAIRGLLVVSVMKTPPVGAAVPSATGKLIESPGATVAFAGKRIAAVWKVHCN